MPESSASAGRPLVAADVARLGQRVLDEGAVRLFRFGNAELRLREHLDAKRCEHLLELAQFAGIVGGDDQFLHVDSLYHIARKPIGTVIFRWYSARLPDDG